MVFKLEITKLAEEEYSCAFSYYEEQQLGLGDKFEKETDRLGSEKNRLTKTGH